MIKKLLKLIFGKDESDQDSKLLQNIVEGKFKAKPCHGSLEIGNHCKGCYFEKDHT